MKGHRPSSARGPLRVSRALRRRASFVAICAAAAAAGPASAAELTPDHEGPLVLGEVAAVPLTVRVQETEADAIRPLRMSVNVGEVGPIERVGLGEYRATYTLPKTRYPQVALFAIWRETGPDAPIAFARIPLSGRTKVPVETVPEATVEMVVAETVFGPVVADARGRAKVEVAVPPGISRIVARSTVDEQTISQPVRIGVPPYNRLTVAITPYAVPADGASRVAVHVYYDAESPPPADRVTVRVQDTPATRLGADGGHYRFEYRPSRRATARAVSVTTRVATDPVSKASVELQLRSPTPEVVHWPPVIAPLPADGATTRAVPILVTDRLGLGVPGLELQVEAEAGVLAPIRDEGEGRYRVALRAPAHLTDDLRLDLKIEIAGHPALTSRGQLALIAPPWPTEAALEVSPALPLADGIAPIQIRVRARDLGGAAFEGGQLRLRTPGREAPIVLTETERGTYEAEIVPAAGEDRLEVTLADASGHLDVRHEARLRPAPRWFSLGARVGGVYDAQVMPEAGLEARYRLPGVPGRRLALFGNLGFRRRQTAVSADTLGGDLGQDLQATLTMIPIALGASFDVFVGPHWQLYGGAGGMVLAFEHRVAQGDLSPAVMRDVGLGARLHAGFEMYGGFVEVAGEYSTFRTSAFDGGGLGLAATLGYRWGLF